MVYMIYEDEDAVKLIKVRLLASILRDGSD